MLVFENLYRKESNKHSNQIQSFWQKEGAVADKAERIRRLAQIVYIARDGVSDQIAAVSTAELKVINSLNNNYLYEFRCFVGQKFRVAGLDVKISQLTLDYLESNRFSEPLKPIGIFSVVENEILKSESAWRRAVWPEIRMHFAGYTSQGHHMRIRYFVNARI